MKIPEISELSLRLDEAYYHLTIATRAVQIQASEHAAAQQDLTEARQAVISKHADDPKALGSNEAARNAKLDELTVIERQDLHEKAEALRQARDQQELARLGVESLRAQLRCHEVAVGIATHGGVR